LGVAGKLGCSAHFVTYVDSFSLITKVDGFSLLVQRVAGPGHWVCASTPAAGLGLGPGRSPAAPGVQRDQKSVYLMASNVFLENTPLGKLLLIPRGRWARGRRVSAEPFPGSGRAAPRAGTRGRVGEARGARGPGGRQEAFRKNNAGAGGARAGAAAAYTFKAGPAPRPARAAP
jgi:hypothetical protein